MPMRRTKSAGLLMYRQREDGELEVLLAHPGGPFFAKKDAGAWTIPKGEIADGEEELSCARREFFEETGMQPPAAGYLELGTVQQAGGKLVRAWAFEGDWGARELLCSSSFELEWPPRTGRIQRFPEIDRAVTFTLHEAREKLNPAQVEFLNRLVAARAG
jgi:predicted NUDIX family NTP pyrophosphohydrolase